MKQTLTVVSLGPGDPSLITLQTADAMRRAKRLILRTARHPAADWLRAEGVAFETLDPLYDRCEDFDALHRAMAAKLWQAAAEGPVTYAVADATNDGSVVALGASCPEGAVLTRLPGVTRADACLNALPAEQLPSAGLRILPATACSGSLDPGQPLLVTELDNAILAGDVKLWLSDLYGDEQPVVLFPSSVKAAHASRVIPLMTLDRQRVYDHTVAVYLPALPLTGRDRYGFDDLLRVMAVLRGEDGCPWDRTQTHESLRPCLLEEAWEVSAAIDEGDPDHLADELGDLLLQVVFHADIGRAYGEFGMTDVTSAICAKMISRHPRVFPVPGEAEARDWDESKMRERGLDTHAALMADVPRGLPALMRAAKIQKKAAKVGFDWDSPQEALPKIHEEAEEVLAELARSTDPTEELGDLLFSCVNVARLSGADPEEALHRATEKFIRRFTAMEKMIISDGKSLKGLTLCEMDVYWNQVKAAEGKQASP